MLREKVYRKPNTCINITSIVNKYQQGCSLFVKNLLHIFFLVMAILKKQQEIIQAYVFWGESLKLGSDLS